MPYGYLITAVLATLCTLVGYFGRRRPFVLGLLSLVLGVVYNEAPLAVFAVLAGSVLASLGEPGLGSAIGWVGSALFLVTAVGLLALALRGARTDRVIEAALDEGFGADRPVVAAGRSRVPAWLGAFRFPWVFGRRGVRRIADLSYGEAGRRNRLDVYRRREPVENAPVLIHLHGGAFFRGSKNIEARALLYRLAAEGWVCISANYRLRPKVGFPEHLIDVKKVLGWVRTHGTEYGADPDTVYLAGTSAGGLLAALAGLTPNEPVYQPGFEHVDTSVTAVICLAGYFGRPDGDEYSPYRHLTPDAPPFFIAHGSHDTLVPLADARRFADALHAVSDRPVVFAKLPGGQHSFDRFNSARFNAVVDGVREFAARLAARG
ncbi:alpha/beta hydrolase [Actinospica robiniae]|uniref:alpha/beta hydrolase n=1 Tax=Actinospica robiniae TaxID=304901 RepID=UPI0004095907|nr:alpha/beta hydrolase [Actinospica robiniae]